ncbi:MAG: Conserved repeat protein [Parcubacteria group bacterium GW2011_GWA1_47_10]|nr:MAG: Conserved repeat protein [Parcubacteria group bacterium GW2011_GWA1_47_10]
MNKKIFGFGLTLLIIFFFGSFNINTIFAEDEAPVEEAAEDPVVLSGIAITELANKLEYIVGDTLDIGGLEVTGTYSDASTAPIAIPEANISGFDSSAPATGQILTITVDEQTATYTVDILAASDGEDAPLSVEESVVLPNGCEVEDTSGEIHLFPKDTSAEYLAICAFAEALEQGFVDDIEFVDSGFGLFIQSINGIAEENTYWKLNLNSAGASVGVSELELETGDIVSLILMATSFDPETEIFEEEPLDYSLTLTIESLDAVFNNVIVPNTCTVIDTDDVMHTFPKENSPSGFLGVCALVAAKDKGFVDEFEFIDFGFGLFLDSIDGISTTEDFSAFWNLSLNEISADVGITDLVLDIGDTLSLAYPSHDEINLRVIALTSLPEEENDNDGGGGGNNNDDDTPAFSVEDALDYLKNVQGPNGSFANSLLYTDWAAIAYAAADVSGDSRNSLLHYLESNNSVSSLLTDNEMA